MTKEKKVFDVTKYLEEQEGLEVVLPMEKPLS